MPGFELSAEIEAPVDKVWDFVNDMEKELLWQTNAVERRVLSEGPIEKGSRIAQVDRFLGRRIESEWEVVEHHPYYRVDRTITSPVNFEFSVRAEPSERGTRVDMEMEVPDGFGGFFGKLAEPLILKIGRREFESSLATLKDLIEAEG